MIQTRMSLGRAVVICFLALGVCGCFSSSKDKDEGALAEETLVETLASLSRATTDGVRLASDHIRARTDDTEVQRHAIQWQLGTLSICRHCRTMPDARAGIIELWTRIYQMRDTAESDFGKKYLGDGQPIAAEALDKLVTVADQSIKGFFGPEHFEELRGQIETYASNHTISEDLNDVAGEPTGVLAAGHSAVGWVLSLPLKPFEIGRGVGETAHSVQNVAEVADRFTDVVDDLPEEISLQMDLVLLDLNRAPAIAQTLADIERITTSIEGFQKTAENLPDDVRKNVTEVLDELDARQEGLRRTIEDANGLVKELNGVVAGVESTVSEVPGGAVSVRTRETGGSAPGDRCPGLGRRAKIGLRGCRSGIARGPRDLRVDGAGVKLAGGGVPGEGGAPYPGDERQALSCAVRRRDLPLHRTAARAHGELPGAPGGWGALRPGHRNRPGSRRGRREA
jgi:hypothetical protein